MMNVEPNTTYIQQQQKQYKGPNTWYVFGSMVKMVLSLPIYMLSGYEGGDKWQWLMIDDNINHL